ncbi:hypothetical protein G7046_g1389 [Stylonectria norvegica]|nr:hypothetical protein G7046_g1389 [Stylonectria norvegica]
MSTPRTKRLFAGASADPAQRQITSFFNPRSPDDALTNDITPMQPPLPSNVQSNLLSVGMRVRKSVPEGYKTVGTSAFKLWTDNAQPKATTGTTRGGAKAGARELLPFCGINSVGGLAAQPDFEYDDLDEVPDLDELPELTMSQESADGVDAVPEVSRKRIFDEDEANENQNEATPGTLAPTGYGNARVMAVPRSRTNTTPRSKRVGQENVAADDFPEAEFLVYGEGREVEMGN